MSRDLARRGALLGEDLAGDRCRLGIAGTICNPAQELVAGDLEVLEGEREPRQLRRGVRLGREERADVQRPEAQGCVP
jgi:hypothetical protein